MSNNDTITVPVKTAFGGEQIGHLCVMRDRLPLTPNYTFSLGFVTLAPSGVPFGSVPDRPYVGPYTLTEVAVVDDEAHLRYLQQIGMADRQAPTVPALDDNMRAILGMPNFGCAPFAELLRRDGQSIPHKAEEEQAAVIHCLLTLFMQHGGKWREAAGKEFDRIAAAGKKAGGA